MYHTISGEGTKQITATMPNGRLVEQMAETFKALGDPTRVRIIHLLSQAELCVHEQPAMSHHLRLLRMLRLVRTRRDGRAIYYSLDDEHVLELFTCSRDHILHNETPLKGDHLSR